MQYEIIEKMIDYNEKDVKRINHALKVFGYAMTISEQELTRIEEKEIVFYASILHDIGIKESLRKYNSSAWNYQEIEGPGVAEKILKSSGINKEIINRVSFIIGNHHSYDKIDGLDFQILVEADFLVNIFEKEMNKEAIEKIKKKYFKTPAGLKIINSMF